MDVYELKKLLGICGSLHQLQKEKEYVQKDLNKLRALLYKFIQEEIDQKQVLDSARAELKMLKNRVIQPSLTELRNAQDDVNHAEFIYNQLRNRSDKVYLTSHQISATNNLTSSEIRFSKEIKKHTQEARDLFGLSCKNPGLPQGESVLLHHIL